MKKKVAAKKKAGPSNNPTTPYLWGGPDHPANRKPGRRVTKPPVHDASKKKATGRKK